MRFSIFCFLLFFSCSIFAQRPSVFINTYSLSKTDTKYRKVNVNKSLHIKQGVGLQVPIKKLYFYSEFILQLESKKDEEHDLHYGNVYIIEKDLIPTYSLRLGIGKQIKINRYINCTIYPLLEVGYRLSSKTSDGFYIPSAGEFQCLSEVVEEEPSEMRYALGLKFMIDYKLANRWSLGFSLDNYYRVSDRDDYKSVEHIKYDKYGDQESYFSNKKYIDRNTHRFKFIEAGIFINYNIYKN